MNDSLIKRTLLATLVATSLLAAGAMAPGAEAAVDARVRVSIPGGEIAFRTTPRWVAVPNSRVYVVRHDMRPRQDFFRYGGWYYVFDHGSWFRSHRWNGRYVAVRWRDVPRSIRNLPNRYWRAYPREWRDDRDDWRADRRDERWDRNRDDWDDRRDRRDDYRGSW